MKKHFATLLLTGGAMLCACQGLLSDKTSSTTQENEMNEIVFKVKTENTKAVTETTTANLTSFYVSLSENGDGSGTRVDFSEVFSATKSGSVFVTDKYWPVSDPGYCFFATNYDISDYDKFESAWESTSTRGQVMFFPSGLPSQDVVVATAQGYYGTTVPLTFRHIFARLGTMTVNTQSGYTLSVSSISVPCIPDRAYAFIPDYPGYGHNNAFTHTEFFTSQEAWDYVDDGETPAPNPLGFTNKTLTRGSNDFLLLPGTYTISITYTLTKGDYSQTFTKTAEVTLEAGKINNITCTAVGGSAQEIQATVTVQPWNNNSITAEFDNSVNPHPFTVNAGGDVVYFTRADLMYDGTAESGHEWHLMNEPWSTLTMDATLTSSSQIDVFRPGQSGYKDSNPWNTSSKLADEGIFTADWNTNSPEWDFGKHNTIYDKNATIELSSLRCLTLDEANYLINNRNRNLITAATIAGIQGTLLLSDDYVHPAGLAALNMLTRYDTSYTGYSANVFTEEEFREMESNGAVFLRELITSYCDDPTPSVDCFIIDWSYNTYEGAVIPNASFPINPRYGTSKARVRLVQDPS